MAKRFTDTDKWKKPFIRGLPTRYKLLWFYILDDCNHAGIWEVDLEVAGIRCGESFTEDEALSFFGDRVQKISDSKWFLADFVFFQYGELSEKNRLHLSVIQILNKYQIKGLVSPLEGVKDKDKEKDKDMDKEYRIENCLKIALNDPRWVRANKATEPELQNFNAYLEKLGKYDYNPLDYKKYFATVKGKYPELLKRKYSIDEYRAMAIEQDKSLQNGKFSV